MILPEKLNNILKMFKISGEVIKFFENTIENWKVKQEVRGKSLTEVKIHWGIFQVDVLSPLLFVIVTMTLNHVLRKCEGGYKHKFQEKINLIMYMDGIKHFAKNKKRTENPNTGSEDIQLRYMDWIWHRKMGHASNEKRKTSNNGRNRTTKSRKNQNAQRKRNVQALRILEADTIKQAEMKYLRRTRKQLETKVHRRNLIKGINTWAVRQCKIIGTKELP